MSGDAEYTPGMGRLLAHGLVPALVFVLSARTFADATVRPTTPPSAPIDETPAVTATPAATAEPPFRPYWLHARPQTVPAAERQRYIYSTYAHHHYGCGYHYGWGFRAVVYARGY